MTYTKYKDWHITQKQDPLYRVQDCMPTLPGSGSLFPLQNKVQTELTEYLCFSVFTRCAVACDESIISSIMGLQGQKNVENYGSHVVNSWLCMSGYLGCSLFKLAKET